MLPDNSEKLSPAQKAWQTRRARDAARTEIATITAGVTKPSPAFDPDKPVVDLWLDHVKVGCGQRRFVVLDVGTKLVRLFYAPQLVVVTIDRVTFDRHARPARDAKVRKIARMIRENVRRAQRINAEAGRPVMPDGGNHADHALHTLQHSN